MKATDVGEAIRKVRLERGLTQSDVRKRCGLSGAQMCRIETGQQGLRSEVAVRLAKALKVPVFRFFMTGAEWRRWERKA